MIPALPRDTPGLLWERRPVTGDLAVLMPDLAGYYTHDAGDGLVKVFVGREPDDDGRKLWHLSISHPRRYPTWDEVADARYRFTPDRVTMAILLPPSAQYVNFHPTTFHLWQVQTQVGAP